MNVLGHLKYLWYVLRHKWFVFIECCKLGIPWRGLVHDLSKFRPSEWFPYVAYFYPCGRLQQAAHREETGYYKPTDTGDAAFDFAWFLHQKRNDHHWQWWVLMMDTDDPPVRPQVMSNAACREMLGDWRGAGRAQGYGDNTADWYVANQNKMLLHPQTRDWIEAHI